MKLETDWVRYESAGQAIPAFHARPPGARGPLPAVVVVHELFGVEEHIEDVSGRLAAAGYEALAPDLWSPGGERPEPLTRPRVAAVRAFLAANPAAWSGPEARDKALASLPEDERARLVESMSRLMGSDEGRAQRFVRYTEIVRGAIQHLRAQPDGTARKIGVMGFCMGGGITGLAACGEPALSAAVVFYGAAPPLESVPSIACPILGHYADPDPRITPAIAPFAHAARAAGKSFAHHVYAAPHAFFNDTTGAYRPDAARAAWARTLSFFLDHLAA